MEEQIHEIHEEAAVQKQPGGKRLKKSNRKPLVVVLVFWLLIIGGYMGLGWYANSLDTFWPGSSVLGQRVDGQTVEQAAETLSAALPELGLMVYDTEEDRSYSGTMATDLADAPPHVVLSFEDLGITVDPNAVAQQAMEGQKRHSLLTAGKQYLSQRRTSSFVNYTGAPTYQLDEAAMAPAAEQAADTLSYPPADTSYTLLENTIGLTAAKNGRQVDQTALLESLRSLDWVYDLSLKAPAATLPAKTLTAQAIYDLVSGEVKNAGYDKDTDSIIPEQVGAEFDVKTAQAALDAAQPGETVEIPAQVQFPAVTAADLEAVLFRDVLGECKTHVSGTNARKANVQLSAATINGYVMNTGDLFSYNEAVGQRTAANGYKPAPAYVKGETVDEIGGGICQTSSTLYLACLRGNIEITERYAHRYVPAYIPWGMDATVSWGGPDYKFTNQTDYPIKIVTEYANNYLTVKILGTNVDGSYAKVTNETLSTTPWETVYQEDPTIAPGTQTEKTSPYVGHKVKTYHTIYDKDGNVIDSHYEATSDYKVRNKVILVAPGELPGAKPPVPADAPAAVPETPVETPTNPAPEDPAPEMPEETDAPIIVVPDLTVSEEPAI